MVPPSYSFKTYVLFFPWCLNEDLNPLAFHGIGISLKAHTSLSFLVIIFFRISPAILKPLFVDKTPC